VGALRRLIRAAALLAAVSMTGLSGASAATTQSDFPFSYTMWDYCNMQDVLVTGVMHVVMIENGVETDEQINWPDTTAVGADGTLYQANRTSNLLIRVPPSGSITIEGRDDFELVSQNGAPNLLDHEYASITVDTDGNVSFNIHGNSDCSGPTPP
jgi:hypothetical protein